MIRSYYNYDRDAVSVQTGLTCPEPTRTQQQFAEEADINVIVRRYAVTGQLPTNIRMPTFKDFEGVDDFKSAADAIATANESFSQMPADIRRRFGNDPAAFVEFCSDDRNHAEAEKMGLLVPRKPATPAPDQPAPTPVAATTGAQNET